MADPLQQTQNEIAALEKQMAEAPPEADAPLPPPDIAAPEAEADPGLPPIDGADEIERDKARSADQVRREAREAQRKADEKERKADEKEREYNDRLATLQGRLDQINDLMVKQARPEPQKPPEPELPEHIRNMRPTVEFDDDPAAYFKQRDEIDAHRDRTWGEYLRMQERATVENSHRAQLAQTIQAAEYQFLQATPDYYQALGHLQQDRMAEYRELGLNDEQALHLLRQDQVNIARQALAVGKNPAELAYNLAKRRGYQTAQPNGSGAQPPTPAPSAQQLAQMERLQAGTREARTLGSVSGGAEQQMTPDRLLKLSNAEFEAYVSKLSPAQQRALMGE